MKRMLLGLACALSLAAFTTSVARADDKPADASGTTAPAKKHHKKKKAAAKGDDAGAAAGSGTTK